MTEPWLTIVGIGPDGLAGLGQSARDALAAAEILVGGSRHLALLPEDGRPRLAWRSPLADTLPELLALRPGRVVVVATGDPLWYGVGRLLLRHVPAAEVRVLPHVSAFQQACSRLGWAMDEVHALSAHGRSIAGLGRHLQPGRRLLVLTDDGAAPALIGRMLAEHGYGASRTWILEDLIVTRRADPCDHRRRYRRGAVCQPEHHGHRACPEFWPNRDALDPGPARRGLRP